MKEINKGTLVRYKNGYLRVTARFNKTVNLGGIFSSVTCAKGVPIEEVREAYDEWLITWQQSDAYRSM
jgi:hypothetical protein